MSVEENKAAVHRLDEAVNKGDFSIFPELFAPNYVSHGFGEAEAKGPEGIKQSFTTMRTAFPDYQETIEHMVAEGDMVAVSYTIRGTFKGKFGDIAPTGKQMSIPCIVLARFENGKQVEAWVYIDWLTFYQQLGVSPPGQ